MADAAPDYGCGAPANPPLTLSAVVFLTFRLVGFFVAIAMLLGAYANTEETPIVRAWRKIRVRAGDYHECVKT